jgi:hypothetical protein
MPHRQVTIKERNEEYYDAAVICFSLHKQEYDATLFFRGVKNLIESIWRVSSTGEMSVQLNELITRIKESKTELMITEQDAQLIQAVYLEAQGWYSSPPNPEFFIKAIKVLIEIGEYPHALDLLSSLIAFVEPEDQMKWTHYGLEIAERLDAELKDAYYILLIEPLLNYAEGDEKSEILQEIFQRAESLSQIQDRSHAGNLAVVKGMDLIHPYRIEFDKAKQIRQNNVHELVRSLSTMTHNRLRGQLLSFLGSSYYRMAEYEKDPEIRQDLYKKAKDRFLESVQILERTYAYGELLNAYILAGTGFLSIAELEQDFATRNEFYRLGKEHLQQARFIGSKTQLYHLRARAAINLGVALERLVWFLFDLEQRKEVLLKIYQLQLEGKELAEKTKLLRGAGYATMNASEMCGFLTDLETSVAKKREWAIRQRDLSQEGLALMQQTQDYRGKVVALGYAAFACSKEAELSQSHDEMKSLYEEMLTYAEQAVKLVDHVPDPVATAYAFQKAGDATQHLGVLTGNSDLLTQSASYYSKAVEEWRKTGEKHKEGEVITLQADILFHRSGLDSQLSEEEIQHLLQRSKQLHEQAANLFTNLFFFHDAGENYWRIGQIQLLEGDYHGAQETFDQVQKSFNFVTQLVPSLAENYPMFSTFGITFVGLVDGLKIINRGDFTHAALLFEELANGLNHETERSLRQLRQLLEVLAKTCHFTKHRSSEMEIKINEMINRMLTSLKADAYEIRLPYGLYTTLQHLQTYVLDHHFPFPLVLLDLPLKEKVVALAQTRHLVSTAMSLYKATADQRESTAEEPTTDAIRSYVARISSIVANR